MTRLLFASAALLLAGCATGPGLYQPVQDPRYTAIGHDPFWMVAIGDDRIVLRLGHDGGEEAGEHDDVAFPRTLPRHEGDARIWQSGEGTRVIAVEARPGPCTSGGREFEDNVRVTLSGRELFGCGGRLIRPPRR